MSNVTEKESEELAKKLANRKYGGGGEDELDERVTVSIYIPKRMAYFADDLATTNKRNGLNDKSVSELFRTAFDEKHPDWKDHC